MKINVTQFVNLFSSAELWTVPIESFIEAYCLIFTPPDEEEDSDGATTERYKDITERLKIYEDFKRLINEILQSTLLMKHGCTRQDMYASLGDLVQEENFEVLAKRQVFESLKYIFAVEDFRVFETFMEEMNILMNEQTQLQLAEARRLLEREEKKRQKDRRRQGDDVMELAI